MARCNYTRSSIREHARLRGFPSVKDMLDAEPPGTDTATDPNIAFRVSCMNFDGDQDSTTFTDASGKVWTADTVRAKLVRQPRKFGTASLMLDGSSSITTPNSADFNFPGDFWLEGWAYRIDTNAVRNLFSNYQNSANGISVYIDGSNRLCANVTGDVADITGSTTVPTGDFFHWALGRSGSTIALYLDGVQEGTFSSGASFSSTAVAALGRLGSLSLDFWAGFLGGFRAYKGFCLHTASFTPPTGRFPEA